MAASCSQGICRIAVAHTALDSFVARLVVARWGLRGIRIGEASHPGPPSAASEQDPEEPEIPEHPFAEVESAADAPPLASPDEPDLRDRVPQRVARTSRPRS